MSFMKLGAIITAIVLAIGLFIWGVHEINKPENNEVGLATEAVSEVVDPINVPDADLDYSKVPIEAIPAPIPEPVVVEPEVVQPPQPQEVVPPVAPVAPVASGMDLINSIMAQYGVYAHPATRFVIGPCPGYASDACVKQDIYTATGVAVGSNITLYIKADQITPYLLIHEIAHTHGIMDECAADRFAQSYVGGGGHYC